MELTVCDWRTDETTMTTKTATNQRQRWAELKLDWFGVKWWDCDVTISQRGKNEAN